MNIKIFIALCVVAGIAPTNSFQLTSWTRYKSALASTELPTESLSVNQHHLQDGEQFPRSWVPLASTFELDPNKPTPVSFLDQKYVVYQGEAGNWVVMDDACPHRLAPLSEGRIVPDTRNVECAYHGWVFDNEGHCQRVPQLADSAIQGALSNKRCNVKSYSLQVVKNIVFFWPWAEDPLSVIGTPEATPEYMMEAFGNNASTYTRDLPYGWDTLLENIVDVAHVPFAHHGLQGTRDDAIAINMSLPVATPWGFDFEFDDRTMKKIRKSKGYFLAPFAIHYKGDYDDGGLFNLNTVLIPTGAGRSRIIIVGGVADKPDKEEADDEVQEQKKPSLLRRLLYVLPVWVLHQFSNRFLDSDLAFLHYQEREREKRGKDVDSFFMPAPVDRPIRAIRTWVNQYAHIPKPLPASPTRRTDLFDRLNYHTVDCKHCYKALTVQIPMWKKRLTLSICFTTILNRFLLSRIAFAISVIGFGLLSKVEQSFKQGNFEHYKS